ncbi:MAG: ABC transporter permease [Verrucomicrobiota bacterium]|nr:ABC transporter permease [Verrucomicrobiota bacterium]
MNLPYPLFLALRYLRPKRTFISIITMISVIGVTLGVAVLIVVISVMTGFREQIRKQILTMTPEITISNGSIIQDYQDVIKTVRADKEITGAAPFVTGPILMEFNNRYMTPFIRGIDIEQEKKVLEIDKFLVQGRMDAGDDEIVLGDRLAAEIGIIVGDKVTVFSPRNMSQLLARLRTKNGKAQVSKDDEIYLPSEMEVVGIFSTGVYDYDVSFAMVDLGTAQRLYGLGSGVHGIVLKTRDPLAVEPLQQRLNAQLPPPLVAETWIDQNRIRFQAIASEKVIMFFLLMFIVLVAAFGIMNTLITVAVQKTREIGLLKALGARNKEVTMIFVFQGFIVGLTGTLCGLGAGLFVLQFRNKIKDLIATVSGYEIFPQQVYVLTEIPAVISPSDLLTISLIAVFICTAAGIVPAYLASRLSPIRALRAAE